MSSSANEWGAEHAQCKGLYYCAQLRKVAIMIAIPQRFEIPDSQWDKCDPLSAAIKALVRAQNEVAAAHEKYAEDGAANYAKAFAVRREAVQQFLRAADHVGDYEAEYLDSDELLH